MRVGLVLSYIDVCFFVVASMGFRVSVRFSTATSLTTGVFVCYVVGVCFFRCCDFGIYHSFVYPLLAEKRGCIGVFLLRDEGPYIG